MRTESMEKSKAVLKHAEKCKAAKAIGGGSYTELYHLEGTGGSPKHVRQVHCNGRPSTPTKFNIAPEN